MHIRKPSFNFLYFYVSYQSISCFAPSADDQFGSCLWFEQPTATRQQSWLNLFAVLERLGQLYKSDVVFSCFLVIPWMFQLLDDAFFVSYYGKYNKKGCAGYNQKILVFDTDNEWNTRWAFFPLTIRSSNISYKDRRTYTMQWAAVTMVSSL